jgi:16S rRNA (guanine527-N7)-methyltransferase
MPTLTETEISELLRPYLLSPIPDSSLYPKLSTYLDLLLKWNARTNLTAIRDPEEIVRRHFGESLFAGQHLGACDTLLDFGSGAGFPGLPIAILRPDIQVTLAESQNKKSTFLREVVRSLGMNTEICPMRVEAMPPTRQFHTVTLRAVDNMTAAITAAEPRAGQTLMLLTTSSSPIPTIPAFVMAEQIPLPGSTTQHLLLAHRNASV